MKEYIRINNDYFDDKYYYNCCGQKDYVNGDWSKKAFQRIARRIVDEFKPKSVFDAGCACGHLVAALRDFGVEAYGIDISEYAIKNIREDIRPYCAVASLASELPPSFPGRFDLVTNIEVLEHIPRKGRLKSA